MEQPLQRENVRCCVLFHTPRLRNTGIRISPAASQSLTLRAGHHSPSPLFWLVFGTYLAPCFASWPAHRFGGRNCSDLRGSEGLKVENRGRIPIVDAQADGYQTAFAPIRLTKSEQLPGGDLDAVGVVAW